MLVRDKDFKGFIVLSRDIAKTEYHFYFEWVGSKLCRL
jgi:hypothetical protein